MYLLLGAGVTKLLVQSGIRNIEIVDSDNFKTDNLMRHELPIAYTRQNKAKAMKQFTIGVQMQNVVLNLCSKDKQYFLGVDSHVLEIVKQYKQDSSDKLESGGQLFSYYNKETVIISFATGPSSKDVRKRNLFKPHIPTMKKNIKKFYKQGLHYIGDWHTHAEYDPKPSVNDILSIHSRFNESEHELKHMILMIIGAGEIDLYVGLSNGNELIRLYLDEC